jgi:hypothetical protein
VDKCSNNFVSNYKKHYVASVFNDINSLGGTGVKSSLSESANKFEQSVAIVCLSVRLVRSTKNPMEQSSVLSCWLDMRDNLGGQLVRQSLNECIPKNCSSFFLFSLDACRSGLFT